MHIGGSTEEPENPKRNRQRTQQRITLSGKPLTLQVAKRGTTVRYVVIHAAYFLFMFCYRLLAAPPENVSFESAPLFFSLFGGALFTIEEVH